MRVRLPMQDALVECAVPSTAAEVLELLVRIHCIDDPEQRLGEARQWFVRTTRDELPLNDDGVIDWPLTDGEDLPGSAWVWAACDLLIARASLPDDVVDDVVRLERRKYGVPDDWKPESRCDCVQCRWKEEYGEMPELPPEHQCIYDDIDPRAPEVISRVAGVDDLSQPWWAVQAQSALRTAQAIRFRYQEYKRDVVDPESKEISAELGDLLRGHGG